MHTNSSSVPHLDGRVFLRRSLLYSVLLAKNIVKRLIGRPWQRDPLYEQYVLQRLGLSRIAKMTCVVGSGEGAGSQALIRMDAIIFSRLAQLTYIHTPFVDVGHSDRPQPEWDRAWELCFNISDGEIIDNGAHGHLIDFSSSDNFDLLGLYGFDARDIADKYADEIPEVRRKYYANKSPRINTVFTICAHVRRGDVTVANRPDMWTEFQVFVDAIKRVREVLDRLRIQHKTCIVSQGGREDFSQNEALNATLLLNQDPIASFKEAVEADLLIMSKSSFSYAAAMISDGIKIYEPYSRPPMAEWIVRDDDGKFSSGELERQIRHVSSVRQ
jgi:hypothetical protein